ncbi:MAG: 3-dehydroquinate synthase [Dehalococcoidia bacterium]|nr:3-dehydroquinate synthase [Dehalococcoidia bacterium]MDW8119961.1 3-dehydroquinate synthase [Chloroflexota bacterium]
MKPHLILIGFSGTGKSAIGREVARLLGWPFVDTDQEIVRRAGKPIAAIFAQEGEEAFRTLETQVLADALASPQPTVIATGGGAVLREANRQHMAQAGVVICLEARPDTILQRLVQAEDEVRPLLAGPQPLERIRTLKAQRQPLYALADWTVHTDHLSVDEAAHEVVRGYDLARRRFPQPADADADLAAIVHTSAGPYAIYAGWNLIPTLGQRLQRIGLASTAYLVSDRAVFYTWGRKVQTALEEADIPTHIFTFPPGEASKTLDTVRLAYGWLASLKAQRGHLIVAVGGGVVGDLAGFVAATYNRGMPFIQVPTTLLAMVDAAIGGKTGVDLPEGKNLVGAFHQPRMVLADAATLSTLPPRALREGWAETIKHGLILDAHLFRTCEEQAEALLGLDRQVTVPVLRRSMAIKAAVVSQDEKETKGLRILLNYGHTVGHALEQATGYTDYLHGEAVAIGMMAEGRISQRMGLLSAEGLERQRRVLERFGLPTACPGVDPQALKAAMAVDKKRAGKGLRWVLLADIGRAVVRADVPDALVDEALREITGR